MNVQQPTALASIELFTQCMVDPSATVSKTSHGNRGNAKPLREQRTFCRRMTPSFTAEQLAGIFGYPGVVQLRNSPKGADKATFWLMYVATLTGAHLLELLSLRVADVEVAPDDAPIQLNFDLGPWLATGMRPVYTVQLLPHPMRVQFLDYVATRRECAGPLAPLFSFGAYRNRNMQLASGKRRINHLLSRLEFLPTAASAQSFRQSFKALSRGGHLDAKTLEQVLRQTIVSLPSN